MKIELIQGDITQIKGIDGIVNAANTSLLGGGGVDGAIHRKGGKAILEECQKIRAKQGGCKTGQAVITIAGLLDAKYVIHAVGPKWVDGQHQEAELLYQSYKNSLLLAAVRQLTSLAFPNISTGIYGFSKAAAAEIAIQAVNDFSNQITSVERVVFVCFDDDSYSIYQKLLAKQVNVY
ncbi:O-acetyl-ADP-ribose deacetylase (regulator of RNase III) [Acinetobacter calcoaceticus]|uniref:O-acetyl-ADP-ribose deacetylase (Regulator of RNase III) n=1 Tax=Acinetobacter calcoaceticus TaxID=471 RepID=A0A4R1Y9S7_ACICA|nr:O-acetyl-ADP-ribose deacetylase (regulator of RNase III) [Acinetobacter calcoaceticus]